jgi:poly(A) polymerase
MERLINQIFFSLTLKTYWEILRSLTLRQGIKKLYLVGGALRDLILEQPLQDLDIVVGGEAKAIARDFANKINAHLVMLNEMWKIYRVIKEPYTFDFTPLRGTDIFFDLSERDYTINTLAIDIFNPKKVIDPFFGQDDTKKQILRMVGPKAFWHDPLRILRGIRFGAELGFSLEEKTHLAMKRYASLLKDMAGERIYYEIKKIFLTSQAINWVKEMGYLDIFKAILPELEALKGITQNGYHHLDVYNHSILSFEKIESIINEPESILPDFKKDILTYLKEPLHIFCLKWAALCHDIGKPLCWAQGERRITFYQHNNIGASLLTPIVSRLHFSNKEKEILFLLIIQHMWPFHLLFLYLKKELTLRAIYRLIRKTEPHTIGLFLLALADNLAAQGDEKPQGYDEQFLSLFKKVMEIRVQYLALKQRPRLITGNDIKKWFKLESSPLIGKLLKEIEEMQFRGKIKTKEEARFWLEQYLKEL